MDLVAVERQLREAEGHLAAEVRLGELRPSPLVALRCERLYRTVAALQQRRARLVRGESKGRRRAGSRRYGRTEPHTVPTSFLSPWAAWGDEDRLGLGLDLGLEKEKENAPLPLNSLRPRTERWLAEGGGLWQWKGRTLRVVKCAERSEGEVLERLAAAAERIDARLTRLEQARGIGPLQGAWDEETRDRVDRGEALGEERTRAREAARRQLQARSKALRAEAEHSSAVAVQSVFRGHLGRRKMREAKAKYSEKIAEEKAVAIQASMRGMLARREMGKLKLEHERVEQELAAKIIQAQVRGRQARKLLKEAKTPEERRRASARVIQAWWRGYSARAAIPGMRAEYREARERQAAIMFQSAIRGHLAQRRVAELRAARAQAYAEAAAIMVQAAYRGHMARKRTRAARDELGRVDDKLASMEYANRVKTTFYAKKFLDAKQRAAVLIQALARGYADRKRVRRAQSARRKSELEDQEIERLIEAQRRRRELEAAASPRPRAAPGKVVFEDELELPLERDNGARESCRVRLAVREVARPYQLRIEAEELESAQVLRRKVDLDALEELLAPLFEGDPARWRHDPHVAPFFAWVVHGKPFKRKELIVWLLQRMWLMRAANGDLDLCLGSAPDQLDQTYSAAIPSSSSPPGSPLASPDSARGAASQELERMLRDAASPKQQRTESKDAGGPTRHSFVVRYADKA